MGRCLDTMTRQATLDTFERTAIDGDDWPPGGRNPYERGNAASDPGDAGHFRFAGSFQSNSKMVRQLGGA